MPPAPSAHATLHVANVIAEMARIANFVDRFGVERRVPAAALNDLNLCLDELLNNTISYGYSDKAKHFITVTLSVEGDMLIAKLEDDAVAFDPRKAKPPPSGELHTRPVGGLGLHLVNSLMDQVDYSRRSGFNRVTLKKRFSKAHGQ